MASTLLGSMAPDGDIVEVLWFDGQGLCLFAKRLERGRFVWPQASSGVVSLTPAQLAMLLEGIDWRMPQRTWQPETLLQRKRAAEALLNANRCMSTIL